VPPLTPIQEKLLLALALFGLIVPNGIFLYYAFCVPSVLVAALGNPAALLFIGEAFLLMVLLAWLIHHFGLDSPGWRMFIIMSLLGSLTFSVPAFLYLTNRKARRPPPLA